MKKIALILMTFVLLTSVMNFVVAHTGEDNSAHHSMMGGTYGWWVMGFFGWIFMILIIVALVLLIIWLIKQIQEPKRRRK